MDEGENDLITVAQTAKLLRRSTEQVRRYLREGVLAGRRIGGQWFIARPDVDALRQRQQPVSDLLRRIAGSDPDPLAGAIAIGGSGGGDVASRREIQGRDEMDA